MINADHNFRVLIYSTWKGGGEERRLRFEVDASTEGGRCLVLSNVHDLSFVTACRVEKNYLNFEVSYLINSQR
jgi:hypothetical protein